MKKGESKQERDYKRIGWTILVAFAIISFWRGVWQLMDYYFFPNHILISNWASLGIGLIILFLTKNIINRLN
jgi:hypothetical protein